MTKIHKSPRQAKKLLEQKSNENNSGWALFNAPPPFDINDYLKIETEPPQRIANIYPQNKITLAYGVQGTGKSTGTMNLLNNVGVVPIYVNIDDGGLINGDTFQFEEVGYNFIDALMDGRADEHIAGKVIVIDTYTKLVQHRIFKDKSEAFIVMMLEELCDKANVTLIVIGHAQMYSQATNVFNDNMELIRSAYEVILYTRTHTQTREKLHLKENTPNNGYEYTATIEKGGNGIGAGNLNKHIENQLSLETAKNIIGEK